MRSNSSATTVLIILLVIFTFPVWIGLGAGIIGLVVGLFGAAIGLVAGIFGAILGVIGGIFGWLFDWDHHWHGPFHFWNANVFAIILVTVIVLIVTRAKKR
jgi:hypothetical protein